MTTESSVLVFFVNGKKISEKNPDPECTLLKYLREKLHLSGTKLGCGEGGCGACTVMVSRIDRITKQIDNIAVNACLIPVCSLHGCAVITIEGIGSTRTRLHPVQERLAKAHGSQCGFCTPGIIMSMYTLIRNTEQPSMHDMEIAFQGNLCRCTGYRPILEGYKTFTKEFCNMGKNCCRAQRNSKNGGNNCQDSELFAKSDFQPYDPSQEPIFPPELQINSYLDDENIIFRGPRVTWYRPLSLKHILQIKDKYPEAKIVVGNSEIGVEMKFRKLVYPHLINPIMIREMNEIRELPDGLFVGAAVSLVNIEKYLKLKIDELPEEQTRFYQCAVNMFFYFAGKQIRNVASLGGNIMTSSPISDMNPVLCAVKAKLTLASIQNDQIRERQVAMDENFFTAYRKNIIEPSEIIVGIHFPKTHSSQYLKAFKQARRRDDDIAIVTIAMNVVFESRSDIVKSIGIAFGGMGPTTMISQQAINHIIERKWDRDTIERVVEGLNREFPLRASASGGIIAYRRSLMMSLFFKSYLAITEDLIKDGIIDGFALPENERSGTKTFHTPILKSSQLFEKVDKNQPATDPIGRPELHASALKQATGEAIYCDDIPRMDNELYLSLLLSTRAHAKILAIDAITALAMDGVHAFFSAVDLTQVENTVGPVFHDEEVFVSTKIQCCGQVIGAIVADDQAIAQRAVSSIRVVYEDLKPVIVTTEDAIAQNSFFPDYPVIKTCGNVEEALEKSDHVVNGRCRTGGQEHFYLETNAAVAVPRDTDEIELFCSTQHPTEIQKLVAHVLSIPSSHVVCRAKRLGGGFGGKESRAMSLALPVALAAYRLQRPVRCMLDRDEDMMMTGNRHPFLFKYKVGCTKEGLITGCDIECYANAGWSMDLSFSVLDRAMNHFMNCYRIPNVKCSGWLCKTNLPSNTAFRGFGGPQGMFAAEHIIRDVARVTGKNYLDVMQLNFFKTGDRTFYNQKLENFPVERCFRECLAQSNFSVRQAEIEEFNRQNRWRKRGIAIVPTMYGIAFGVMFLNQAGALINIYADGSVLLTHGGVEIGQGLHTKMIQVAARALKISSKLIYISETSTDKVPNTSATAGSVGSDMNGMAVLSACEKINARLQPIKEKYPHATWNEWIEQAYLERISLSATGFYKIPDIGYHPETNPNARMYSYYTNGAGVSMVEIDCLTGDHQVLRTDIVMDIGSSLNPAIDIGQIEGAFMQGYGLFTLEELRYSPEGCLYSRGPGMYKIPGFADIPGEFNVTLLTGALNPRAVYSSKAVGEPPLFTACSVFFAIKEAIAASRVENNFSPNFTIPAPASSARIRMACEDSFTNLVRQNEEPIGSYIPWSVDP